MTSKDASKTPIKKGVDLNWVFKYLKDGNYPPGLNFSEKRMVRKRAERFCYLNGDLYYVGTPSDQSLGKKPRKVLLTQIEQKNAVEQCHVDAEGIHLGAEKTCEAITVKYHWNGIYKFIKEYIRQCSVCIERHPSMLAPSGSAETVVEEEDDRIVEEDMYMTLTEVLSEQDARDTTGKQTESTDNEMPPLIDLRLFGPYQFVASERFVLMGVGGELTWMEVFVLDTLSTDNVASCLLQMICRYGVVESVTMSEQSKLLLPVLVSALKQLKEQSDMNITLLKLCPPLTASLLKEAQGVIEEFIKRNESAWPEKIDFSLLPLRLARQISNPGKPTDVTAPAIVATAVAPKSPKARTSTLSTTPPISKTPRATKGIVTRSKTGVSTPKTLDHNSYIMPGNKRRFSNEQSAAEDGTAGTSEKATPAAQGKRARLESGTASDTMDVDEEGSDADSETKKQVDLDTYYGAIKMYVEGQSYPDNSSRNFKRLIRDQAKNYCIKGGDLYHEVGVKGQMKKVIMSKEERFRLIMEAHIKSGNKVQLLSHLESVHWKGKLVDVDAFLLASPLGDRQATRDRAWSEAKRQLEYDRDDTYQEIKNYLVYDVFSNDEATKRLDYLKRQLRSFKVVNGELVHMQGNKKQKVLLTAEDRQQAISDAHLKRGSHADLTTTFYALCDSVFWFGMKCDVKVYINYCCTTENKHLLERYFPCRQYLMKHPLVLDPDAEQEERTRAAVDSIAEEVQPTDGTELSDEEAVNETEELDKSDETVIPEKEDAETETMSPEQEVGGAGDACTAASLDLDVNEIVMETEENPDTGSKEIQILKDSSDSQPMRIIVKVTPDGNTIIVNEDGTERVTNTVISGAKPGTLRAGTSNSDDITIAAVKSILKDAGALGSDEYVVQTSTVMETSNAAESDKIGAQEYIDVVPQETLPDSTGDAGTSVDAATGTTATPGDQDEGGAESDDWMYDSDDVEDEEEGYEGEPSLLQQHIESDTLGGKRVVTPRQHFKCSQCNKIFYGPIKFKMHMYKHTGQKPFPCNLCSKKYTNKKSLVIHQRTHTGELPYLCSLCGRRCPSKIALKSHLKCHDSEGGGFPAQCDICERVFTRKHLMERHKLHKHTNLQTEFKCNECNKVFSHQRSLRRHFMSTHLNVKNHICGLCGKSFYRKEYLTGHLIQHGGAAAEGLNMRKSRSSFKPRPSVFNSGGYKQRQSGQESDEEETGEEQVQRIILHQDENGQLRMVDLATEREVKRMLEARGITQSAGGETMVVHIEEPGGESQVVHVEHTEEQVVEVPIEEQHGYVEYQTADTHTPQEFVISTASSTSGQYLYTTTAGDVAGASEGDVTMATMSVGGAQGGPELVYEQPAVQYEVECVGDVGDDEALSAINLLAQASAQQYENVISQI